MYNDNVEKRCIYQMFSTLSEVISACTSVTCIY